MDNRNWIAETGARQASAQARKGALSRFQFLRSIFEFRVSNFDFPISLFVL